MNQIPCVPMMNPYMVQQQTTYMPVPQQPKLNAVNIEINNPTVGTQGVGGQCQAQYAQPTLPLYNYPQAPVYTYPQAPAQQPAYYPPYVCQPMPQAVPQIPAAPQTATIPAAPQVAVVPAAPQAPVAPQVTVAPQAPVVTEAPVAPAAPQVVVVPAPQVVPAQTNINVPQAPVAVEVKPEATAVPEPAVTATEVKPEVVPSETITPQVDLNSFIAKLSNPDFDVQAAGMEEIANMVKVAPDKATELVDTKVFDALTNIINFDSSALAGPTAEQVAAREKIMTGKEVTEAEQALANTITPKEQAERNKSYALFTSAIMQKLYGDEVARLSNQTVPLTELPGAITVVDNLKDNPNPMVRASAIEALSYIQNPAYKKDLTTVFTIAQNDQDPGVAETAKLALERLNQV